MPKLPSPSYGITIRARYANRVGSFSAMAATIAQAGGSLGDIDIVETTPTEIVRDINVDCSEEEQAKWIGAAVRVLPGVEIISVRDRTFQMHLGGKIEVCSKTPLRTRDDLSMAYTPGVARISTAVAADPNKAFALTVRRNMVAVVSDGSAVLGLGNIGPLGALPVMEGKAMLFKEFGGVDAFPICLSTQDTKEIIKIVKAIAPTFGGINLEDISAPRCFEIEERLKAELDIPVFHDDQHGTAAVVLAALFNAVKVVGKEVGSLRVVISGAGAAGVACTKALLALGVADVIVCDKKGAIYAGRAEHMNPAKDWLAQNSNRNRFQGSLKEALKGADLFLGVSGPGLLKGGDLKAMAKDPIVFALSNPVPEVSPEEAAPYVRVMATGRSDYPNQINNVLCFPGLFRGLLDSFATTVTQEMIIAASKAIASTIEPAELSEGNIIPSVFNKNVAPAVAKAVAQVAKKSGLTRKIPETAFSAEM
ncbi:MAG TPA: NAD-dependent malic enzyme [Armatimonadota bacterium]|nr:NAD-dependent malic enzyme [Armatimonadota bacterium]